MKLAAISDIHGNIGALDAVLTDIAARGLSTIVNLGDILSGPLEPAATAERLTALNLPTIRGNHERQLIETEPAAMGASDRYAASQLQPHHRTWIAGLPPTLWLSDDIYLCHGTPADDLDYLLEEVDPAGAHPAPDAVVAQRTRGIAASLILCGHSHMPRVVRLKDGRTIVNPGSVGLPAYDWDRPFPHKMETGTPHARYAVMEQSAAGWNVETVLVAYDWEGAAAQADANDRPDWAVALRTGHI